MNIRDLEYFLALVKFKHFNKAAEYCHVSQPTLSMQIKKLEESLGLPCFERGSKTILLTDFGHQILPIIEDILAHVRSIEAIAQDCVDPFESHFIMGSIHTIAPYLFPDFVKTLHALYPKMKMQLVESKTHCLVEQLKRGHLELIILATHESGLEAVPLFEDELFVLAPRDHPICSNSGLEPEDLENLPMILLEQGHCLAEQMLNKCLALKCVIHDFRATSLETLRAMVIAEQGCTLIPRIAIREDEKLCYVPFNKPIHRKLYAYYRPDTPRESTLVQLCEHLKALKP